jgi:hypothetical protein
VLAGTEEAGTGHRAGACRWSAALGGAGEGRRGGQQLLVAGSRPRRTLVFEVGERRATG